MYIDIAHKWVNNTITNEEVAIFKQKVYSLIPEWINDKINVIDAPDDINYIIITDDTHKQNCLWLYENDVFDIKNKSHIEYLPSNFVIDECYTTKIIDNTITISFAKITGLAFLYCKIKPDVSDKYVSFSNEMFFKSNDCYEKSKNYDDMKYNFTDDKFEIRYNDWYYNNKYKEYQKLGIESDYSTTIESQWVHDKNDTIIEKFNVNELISYDDFINLVSNNFSSIILSFKDYNDDDDDDDDACSSIELLC
jgi:hypothetical protein